MNKNNFVKRNIFYKEKYLLKRIFSMKRIESFFPNFRHNRLNMIISNAVVTYIDIYLSAIMFNDEYYQYLNELSNLNIDSMKELSLCARH